MYCVKCGAKIDDASRFCDACGHQVKDFDASVQLLEEGVSSSLKTSTVAVVAIALVVVILATVLLVIKPWGGSNTGSGDATGTTANVNQQESSKVGDGANPESGTSTQSKDEPSGSIQSKSPTKETLSFSGITKANASSTLPTDSVINVKSYVASNLIDGNHSTVWCEGADGDGIGESVTLSGKSKQGFKGFSIWNGYQESSHLYEINNRVARLTVYADNKLVGEYKIEDRGLKSQRIKFDKVVEAKKLTFEIRDVYSGSKYKDCCISEIECF